MLQLLALTDIGHHVHDPFAGAQLLFDLRQCFLVAGDQRHAGALLDGHACGGQTDAAGAAGDDDDLLVQGFEMQLHGTLLSRFAMDMAWRMEKGATRPFSRCDGRSGSVGQPAGEGLQRRFANHITGQKRELQQW